MGRAEALRVFMTVADGRSFVEAARELAMSPQAVTRSIAALEARLGAKLFHRSTRVVNITEDGATLLEKVRPLLSQLDEAEHLFMGGHSTPQGEFRVTAPVVFGRLHVLPAISQLLANHAKLTATVMLVDRNVQIVEEGIDAAIRIGTLRDSALIRLPLGFVRRVLVASPAYLAARGAPLRTDDLESHDCILDSSSPLGTRWRFGDARELSISPRLTTHGVDGAVVAALAGVGIANVLDYQVREELARGILISVLDDAMLPRLPINLLYHSSRAGMPALRAFRDAMKRQAKSFLH